MVISQAIPIPPEAAIASYDFNDIAEGTGVKTFYGVSEEDSIGVGYGLNVNAIRSAIITAYYSAAGTGSVTSSDFDFDTLVFNLPKIIKGTAYLSVTMGCQQTNDVGMSLTAQVKKLVGSAETNISSVITSPSWNSSAAVGGTSKDMLLAIPITQTHFKIGEQIRLTIIMTRTSGGATSNVGIGSDPADRDSVSPYPIILPSSTTHTTVMKLFIPFKLDL